MITPHPIISIWALTYNQVKYVARALDSILTQQTEYPFEIVIHDDCSTDGTTDIIREYAEKYPDIVKPIYEEVNQYTTHPNAFELYGEYIKTRCRGKYIAMIECDDYWTYSMKLQKQVAFMEKHPEVGFVASLSRQTDRNGVVEEEVQNGAGGFWNLVEKTEVTDDYGEKWMLCGNVFEHAKYSPICRTVTLAFRKDLVEDLPVFSTQDIVFHGILARNTNFAMLMSPTGVYFRGNESSITMEGVHVPTAEYIAKARLSFRRCFPEVDFFSEEAIMDRLYIVYLKQALLDGDYRKAIDAKKKICTPEIRDSFFCKNLRGPLSFAVLRVGLKRYLKKKG